MSNRRNPKPFWTCQAKPCKARNTLSNGFCGRCGAPKPVPLA